MGLRRAATASLAGLLAALSGPASPGAQAPEERKPELVLPTSVEVVRLEVVVTEKRGRARGGLTRDDFAVFEDGKPQPIVQFQAFAHPQPASPARPAPPAATEPAGTEEDETEDLLPARYLVLAIDDVHMEFESLSRVRKVLTRFLEEDLRPEDQVALVKTSGASALSQEFTADRAVLQQTLSRLSAQGHPPQRTDIPYISDYQAELIEHEDPMALDAAAQEVLQAGLVQDLSSAEEVARRKARGVLTEAVYDSRLTLETLESLCRGLSGLTGRKVLFLVSDGFVTSLSARGSTTFDVRRIADAGTRAGVVVYALDTRGLVAAPPGAGAASLRRPGPATFGAVEAMQRRSVEATRDAMNALAAGTGGFLVENSNDLRAGLREMLKDTDTYYVLAYEPTNTKRDGGFRRTEVRLPGVPGARVRTRAGYFALDDRRLGVADGTAEDSARRSEQRRSEMHAALSSLAPLAAIPIRLSADFVSLDPGGTRVVVSGSVDVTTLPFVRRQDRRQATVESVALVYDEKGAVVTTLPTERSAVDLTDADYERLRRRGLPYQKAAALPPGRYQVRLAAREDATGLLGSAWQWVEIPDLAPGRLTLSSLFLQRESVPDGVPGSPGAAPELLSAQALRRFRRTESLYMQLYAYNAKRDASGATDLVSQAEVLRGGFVLGTAAPEPMTPDEAQGPILHTSRIRLQRFDPGDYELRVTVTDRNGSEMATRLVRFTIE